MLRRLLPLLLLATNVRISAAQMPPLTVPRGHWRADITGGFFTADQRWRAGAKENLAFDFERDRLGANFFPDLVPADSLLRKIAGFQDAQIDLGTSSASWSVTTGTFGLGLAYGVFSKLTLSVYVPIIRQKVRSTFGLDPELANSGFNPADQTFGDAFGQAQTNQFFQQFTGAMTQLAERLASGAYDGDPGQKALAQQTLASGTVLHDDLFALILGETASPFLPTTNSVVGNTIRGKVTSLQGALTSLGVTTFNTNVALPAEAITPEEFDDFIGNDQGPVNGTFSTPSLSSLGDIEIGAAYAIFDQLSTAGVKRGFRLAAQGLLRLRTSQLDNPGRFFDVGTGERQPDLEGTLVGDGLFGAFGARALAGYNLQLTGDANKRISAPENPIAYQRTFAAVNRKPGDVITLGVAPFYRMADNLAVTGGVTWRKKASDEVTLLSGQTEIEGAPPSLLEIDTDGTWTTASFGLTYSAPLLTKDGKSKAPVDAGVLWEGVINSSGSLRVPATYGVRFWFRLYGKL